MTVQTAGGSTVQLGAMDSLFDPNSEIFTSPGGDVFQLTSASALHAATSVTLNATLDLHGLSPTFNILSGAAPSPTPAARPQR